MAGRRGPRHLMFGLVLVAVAALALVALLAFVFEFWGSANAPSSARMFPAVFADRIVAGQ